MPGGKSLRMALGIGPGSGPTKCTNNGASILRALAQTTRRRPLSALLDTFSCRSPALVAKLNRLGADRIFYTR